MKLKSTGVYTVIGDLTIKNIVKPITFDLKLGENTGLTKLKIDRTKYDITYGSKSFFKKIGNQAISDEFYIIMNVVF